MRGFAVLGKRKKAAHWAAFLRLSGGERDCLGDAQRDPADLNL